MEQIRKFFINNHQNMRHAVVPTLVVMCVFFVNYCFFGMDNTIIGPCLTLSYLYFRDMNNRYCSMLKTLLIYEIVAFAAWIAGFSLPLCILCNAAVFFWNIYFRADENHPANYYTPGMMFILFQLFPVKDLPAVFQRAEALAASFAVTLLFLLLFQNKEKSHSIRDNIVNGFEITDNLLNAYKEQDPEKLRKYRNELREMSEVICDEIYLHNYSGFGSKSKANWYCRFIAFFQAFHVLSNGDFRPEVADIMNNLGRNLKTYFMKGDIYEHREPLRLERTHFDIRSMHMRFALQQVVALTPCMAFAYLFPFGNGFWLPVSIYFMLVPFYENVFQRVSGRISGTVIGVLLCAVLYTAFPGLKAHIVILIALNFLINSTTNYSFSVVYITCAILALGISPANMAATLLERLAYTLIGAVITFAVSRYVLPFRTKNEVDYLYEQLIALQDKMMALNHLSRDETRIRRAEENRLLIESYVLSRRIRLYNETLKETEKKEELLKLLDEHITKMSYFFTYHFTGVKRAVHVTT